MKKIKTELYGAFWYDKNPDPVYKYEDLESYWLDEGRPLYNEGLNFLQRGRGPKIPFGFVGTKKEVELWLLGCHTVCRRLRIETGYGDRLA